MACVVLSIHLLPSPSDDALTTPPPRPLRSCCAPLSLQPTIMHRIARLVGAQVLPSVDHITRIAAHGERSRDGVTAPPGRAEVSQVFLFLRKQRDLLLRYFSCVCVGVDVVFC